MPGTAHPAEPPMDCQDCPRLAKYREANSYTHPDWHNGPVASFGSDQARFLIVGLAPGVQGANRTGRPFTGDYAGDLLYSTLEKFGFSNGKYACRPDDGLELVDTMITNAVRCVPPENTPIGPEINACRNFLTARLGSLPNLKAILALGVIAHDSTLRALGTKPSGFKFGHANQHDIQADGRALTLFDSYHCSRYNTNTRRLTEEMFHAVFEAVRRRLDR